MNTIDKVSCCPLILNWWIVWLIGWLIDWYIGWLTGWWLGQIGWLMIDWDLLILIDWLIENDWLIGWLFDWDWFDSLRGWYWLNNDVSVSFSLVYPHLYLQLAITFCSGDRSWYPIIVEMMTPAEKSKKHNVARACKSVSLEKGWWDAIYQIVGKKVVGVEIVEDTSAIGRRQSCQVLETEKCQTLFLKKKSFLFPYLMLY